MFPEHYTTSTAKNGWIEMICGSMFSGKSEELIRRLNAAKLAGMPIAVFKPETDSRYHPSRIVSHNGHAMDAVPVKSASELPSLIHDEAVIGIDEVQFFDDKIIEVCESFASQGKRVIAAGLSLDYSGKPFGPVPSLLAVAAYVTKLNARCMVCGEPATHTFRKSDSTALVLLGSVENYEARCRHCFNAGMSS